MTTTPGLAGATGWRAALRSAGRAAAFLAIAAGVAGTATSYFPTFDERWIYIVVVAVIAAFEGLVTGTACALAAVICFEAMSHGRIAPSAARDFFVLAGALVGAFAGRGARLAVSAPRIPSPPTHRLLLAAAEPAEDTVELRQTLSNERLHSQRLAGLYREAEEQTKSLTEEVERLRQSLDAQKVEVASESARAAAVEARLQQAETDRGAAAERVGALTRELDALRSRVQELTLAAADRSQSAQLEAANADARRQIEELHARATDLQVRLDAATTAAERSRVLAQESETSRHTLEVYAAAARDEVDAAQRELQAAKQELESARSQADAARAESTAIATKLHEAEEALRAGSQQAATRDVSVSTRLQSMERDLAAREERLRQAERDLANAQANTEALTRRVRDLDGARAAAEMDRSRVEADLVQMRAALNSRITELQTLRSAAESEREKSEREIARATLEATALAARVDELEAHRGAEADRHAGSEAALRLELRNESERASALEARLAEIEARRIDADERLEQSVGEWTARLEEARRETSALAHQAEQLREERDAATLELQQRDDRIRAQTEDASSEIVRLRALIDELQTALAAVSSEREKADVEWQVRLAAAERAATTTYSADLEAARAAAAAAMSRIAEMERERQEWVSSAASQRAELEQQWDHKLQTIVHNLASDHEADLGQAVLEREQARAEVRQLSGRLGVLEATLQQALQRHEEMRRANVELERHAREAEERASAEAAAKASVDAEWDDKLQRIVHNLASDHESDMGQALLEKEEARAEVRRLSSRLASVGSNLANAQQELERLRTENAALLESLQLERGRQTDETSLRERLDAEWSEKLQRIVTNLATDHENDLGTAMLEKEEAKAEARKLSKRVQALESTLRELSSTQDALQRENAALRAESQEERYRADHEGALREKLDAEWSEKLQTIVTHLASDHEADMGQALLEKEEARAEARSLNMKLGNLAKTLENEREAFRGAAQKWVNERHALLREIESLKPAQPPATAPAAAWMADDTQPAAAGNGRKPSVVLVHRDATLRTIAKHALERSGYEVTTAADGLEAFRLALSQKPDVILAESQMAKMDGRALVQLLKSRPETARVKIVLMTSGDATRDSAADFRADDFLRDPANVDALKATLEQVLANAR